jgi:hypothetical protein
MRKVSMLPQGASDFLKLILTSYSHQILLVLNQANENDQAKTFEKHFDENSRDFTSNTKCSEQ